MRLHYKLIILMSSLLLVTMGVFQFIFQDLLEQHLNEEMGQRALAVAQAVAHIPDIQEAFATDDPAAIIQPVVEKIRKQTHAEFIVVGNLEEIRYSHPIAERIGKKMMGGDNAEVFKGKEIVSRSVGSLGPSLRGKVPMLDVTGQVIGVVSVGFLLEDINEQTGQYKHKLLLVSLFVFLGGIIGALGIAYSTKKAIFGFEPHEIAHMYQQKQAILTSIHEGIIAINSKGIITAVNAACVNMLGLSENDRIEGKQIQDLLPSSRLLQVVASGHAEFDQEMIMRDEVVVVNRLPIYDYTGNIIGAVSSFRYKSELTRVMQELSHVKAYAEGLRAQTHEYSNKLYTISGLIQLESYQEAIDLITKESDVTQNLMHFIQQEIPDPIIGGLLLGKVSRAHELKVDLIVDYETTFVDIPAAIDCGNLVTIIGNLLDNAMDAVLETDYEDKKVQVFMTDLGEDLIIEVDDNGIGIQTEHEETIFQKGFTTKHNGENSGFGLALVSQAVSRLNGYITFCRNEWGGTTFTVAIPKQQKE